MELLDRYLDAVKSYLPKAQQDDIVSELRDNLQSQMDDREADVGRPLTEPEQEAILQQHGHPMIVAGRYQTNQGSLVFGRQVIGPTLFPFYLKALWFTMGVSLAIYLIVLVALTASGAPITMGGVMNAVLLQVAIQFAVVTLIFSITDHYLPTMQWDVWRPPTLPRVAQQAPRVPRFQSVAQVASLLVLLLWLRLVHDNPALLLGPAADTYQLGPIWREVAVPIVLIFLLFIAQGVVNIVRPDWRRLRLVTSVALDVAGLAVLVYVLRADHWIVLAHPDGAGGAALSAINEYVYYGLWVVVVGSIVVTFRDAWKLLRSGR